MNGKKAKMLRKGLNLTEVPRITKATPQGFQKLVYGHPRSAYRAAKRMYTDKGFLRSFMEKQLKGG